MWSRASQLDVLDRVIASYFPRAWLTFADVDPPPSELRRNVSLPFCRVFSCLPSRFYLCLNVRLDSTSLPALFSQAASKFRGS